MIKNYLRIALRNLVRNKSYVIINTLGLGIALACCIAAYMIVAYNIEFDNFHDSKKTSNIFQIHTLIKEKNGRILRNGNAPIVMGPIITEEVAGIERFTRYTHEGDYIRYNDQPFFEKISFADSTFFDMFDYPLVHGNHKSFKNKRAIFLSEAMATKYFGKDDPIGKILVVSFEDNKEIEVTVEGVLKKVPLNNTFYFEALMRIENYLEVHDLDVNNWGDWRDVSTFVQVASPEIITNLPGHLKKYVSLRNEVKRDAVVEAFEVVPFNAWFSEDDINWTQVNVRISAVSMIAFAVIAFMILVIACFNLTNTSIAMTAKRLKEVGVRKSIGASRQQIVVQFLLETVITISLAAVASLLMAQIIVPVFMGMWNAPYGLSDLNGLNFFMAILSIVFIASLLAGTYPAVFNSKFKPVALLKGNVHFKGTNGFTRTLVAMQFALSVIVLVGGMVFMQNAAYQEGIDFGYDKEMVVTVRIQDESEFEAMENEALKNPDILSVAVSNQHSGDNTYQSPVKVDTTETTTWLMGVGKNYFEAMGFNLADGRFFNHDNASDLDGGVIVNKAFLKKVNLQDPMDKIITVHGVRRHIVGILENHIDNLSRSKEPEPFVFYPAEPEYFKIMLVRAEPSKLGQTQKFLESTWKRLFPTKSFESRFQEDIVLAKSKRMNSNLKKIFLFLTILGGLLSASGIFALASLNIAKRTKEIGIRKALGATVVSVVGLLNKEFVIVLFIATSLGSMGGYYLTNVLLDELYAYHITVGIIPVVGSALFIFAIGMCTTSTAIFKAAKTNPVDTLRSE